MARVELYFRTIKSKGNLKLRFRLTDGRSVQLFHKSDIIGDIEDIRKFDTDGTPKKRANYSRKLAKAIKDRIKVIESVYAESVAEGVALTSKAFEQRIDAALHPEKYAEEEPRQTVFIDRFEKYIDDGAFGEHRKKGYLVMLSLLRRFLKIFGMEGVTVKEITPDFIIRLREFIINEYKFAEKKKYKRIYAGLKVSNVPKAPRAQNTTAVKLKQLQAFFAVLEDADEVDKSPFRKIGRENRRAFLSEQYTAPTALTLEEVRKILDSDIDLSLIPARDAFLLQCALGCRISDFKAMTMGNVSVSPDGVPYVRYVAQKTRHTQKTVRETKTPLVRFAFDIVRKYDFNIPVLRNVSGKDGFNKLIKEVLKECGIDREVNVMDPVGGDVSHVPLWQTASSKLGRKTNVTLLSRVQVNTTIAGLHAEGSEAVRHYLDQTMTDLFTLMSKAFGEEPYRVDNELNIIS